MTTLRFANGSTMTINDIGFMERALSECKARDNGCTVRKDGKLIAVCFRTAGGGWCVQQTEGGE
jgi:hypothetical protein